MTKIFLGLTVICAVIFFAVQQIPMFFHLPVWVDGWSLIGIVVFGILTVVCFVVKPSKSSERKPLKRELPSQDHWWGKGV